MGVTATVGYGDQSHGRAGLGHHAAAPSSRQPPGRLGESPRRARRGPLYQYLRAAAPGDFGPQYGDFYQAISKIRPGSEGTDEIKWNFTKFLVGRDGTVIRRYEPPVPPADIKADLENHL